MHEWQTSQWFEPITCVQNTLLVKCTKRYSLCTYLKMIIFRVYNPHIRFFKTIMTQWFSLTLYGFQGNEYSAWLIGQWYPNMSRNKIYLKHLLKMKNLTSQPESLVQEQNWKSVFYQMNERQVILIEGSYKGKQM